MLVTKKILFLFAQIFFCVVCLAQKEKIDSLKKALPSLRDSARVDDLNALSNVYSEVNLDLDSSTAYALQALKDAEQIHYPSGSAKAYYNLAVVKWISGKDFSQMEVYAYKSVTLFEKLADKKQLAAAYFFLGLSYWAQGKFSQAIGAYEKAQILHTTLRDEYNLGETYVYLGLAEEQRAHYARSFEYSLKWLQLSKKNQNFIVGLQVLASLYRDIGDYETALEYFRQCIEEGKATKVHVNYFQYFYLEMSEIFCLEKKYDSAKIYATLIIHLMPDKSSLAKPYSRLGDVYRGLQHYDSALWYLHIAYNDFKKDNDINQVMWVLLSLSKTYTEQGNSQMAITKAKELLKMGNETGARQYSRDAHFLLYELYEKLKNQNEAYNHLQQYTILKDSIETDLSAQKLAFYKIQSEREKTQARIDILNREKQIQQAQLQKELLLKNILVGGIIILLLFTGIVFRNITLKRKNEKMRLQHDLDLQKLESEKQLSELEMQALRAQMNPHFIFNSLNSINRFILQNNKAEASEYLTKFSKLVRMILENSQASAITLESELESLELYLQMEALRFDYHFAYKISVPKDMDTEVLKVPPLILQPYVENAIWHGLMHKEEKGQLDIEVWQEEDWVYLKVTDNGIGRKKASELASKSATKHKSMGLRITANRIAMMQHSNGQESPVKINDLVELDGTASGTEVVIKMPLLYD